MPEPRLFVHDAVLARLRSLPARPWEVGGWLLGYWADDRDSLLITQATPPTRGWPWQVTISGKGHRGYFDAAWEASGGDVTFLGDWHSHPGVPATPSTRDRRALAKLAAESKYGTPEPLLAIVATARWPWRESPAKVRFFLGGPVEPRELACVITAELPESAGRVGRWW